MDGDELRLRRLVKDKSFPPPERTPDDGKPYYCKMCGLGYGEYLACEDGDCKLESEISAMMRQSRKKGTARK